MGGGGGELASSQPPQSLAQSQSQSQSLARLQLQSHSMSQVPKQQQQQQQDLQAAISKENGPKFSETIANAPKSLKASGRKRASSKQKARQEDNGKQQATLRSSSNISDLKELQENCKIIDDKSNGDRYQQRAKTTRVRINSTGEQIQDPSWLIQQLDQQTNQKKSHLRALQIRLLGSGLSKGVPSAGEASTSAKLAPPSPAKVPVSILKQPGSSSPSGRKSPVPASSISPSQPSQQRRHQASPIQSSVSAKRPLEPSQTQPQTQPQPQSQSQENLRPSVVPICADGQVKVSGWKRNNLLAKTLGHLDEIRGNQRPVFMATKITLPARMHQATEVEQEPSTKSPNKFAEVVREAISRRSQLSVLAGAGLKPPLAASKRNAPEMELAEPKRPVSTVPEASGKQASLEQPRRSSSAAPGGYTSPSRAGRAQQVTPLVMKESANLELIERVANNAAAEQPSSARLVKLQLKNNQLLNNLRRQSNELQAARSDEFNGATSTGSSSSAIRDWKRLTGKLGLLTASRQRAQNRHLGAELAGLALRPTVSNQERAKASLLAPDELKARKLSSSSMVVQTQSAVAHDRGHKSSRSAAVSPQLSGRPIPVGALLSPSVRRSSDSEAYRSGSGASSEATSGGALVVNQNDLLQLLQVKSAASSDSSSRRNSNLSSPSRARERHSLQIDDTRSRDTPSSTDGGGVLCTSSQSASFGRSASLDTPSEDVVDHSKVERNSSLEACTSRMNSGQSEPDLNGVHSKVSQSDFYALEQQQQQQQQQQQNPTAKEPISKAAHRKTPDFSWVVKKTSKVAFFQRKLRKMRWNSSQRKKHPDFQASGGQAFGADQTDLGLRLDTDERTLNCASHSNGASSADASKVFMDPTLIGDAIEIFLRSAMQDSSSAASGDLKSSSPAGGVPRTSSASSASSSSSTSKNCLSFPSGGTATQANLTS